MHSSQGIKRTYVLLTLDLGTEHCNNFEILYTPHRGLGNVSETVEAEETHTHLVYFSPALWGDRED